MKSLAAILVRQNAPLVLEEIEIPRLSVGQVLVKLVCSGICGSQIGEINGAKGPDRFLPHLLGHEGTAIVVECGQGVRSAKPGDQVVLHWRKGAGLESLTPTYHSSLGPINAGWVTTFNEYAVVSENRLTTIPADFDPAVGALFGCAVTTAFGVINNNAGLKIGQSIAIFGSGGIGLSIVQGAALASAYPIVAIDRFDNRLELARQLGATHAFNPNHCDVETQIRNVVGENGLDVAIDNTGNVQVIEMAYRLTGPRGRAVLVGVPPRGSTAAIHTLPLHFEKTLLGSHGGECDPSVDIPNYVRLIQAGRVDFQNCLGERYPLTDINQAIDELVSGRYAGRPIIEFPSR